MKRKISHKGARKKGHDFERYVASRFVDAGWTKAKRHLEYQPGTQQGFDLDGTYPFKVQCKKHAKYVNPSLISEINPVNPGDIPVLVTAGNNKEPLACLSFDSFLLLSRAASLYYDLQAKTLNNAEKIKVIEGPKGD